MRCGQKVVRTLGALARKVYQQTANQDEVGRANDFNFLRSMGFLHAKYFAPQGLTLSVRRVLLDAVGQTFPQFLSRAQESSLYCCLSQIQDFRSVLTFVFLDSQ